jgi:DNA-binding SARP family transcriptional activator/tetratricopeptide (TPR) repeat protein
MLALLALDGPVARDRLAAMLWPGSDDQHARGALRRTLSVLSSGLGGRWVVADRRDVRLQGDGHEVDAHGVAEALEAAERHDHASLSACGPCLDALCRAETLHRGELLAGFTLRDSAPFDDWRRTHAERVRRQRCRSLDLLIRAAAERGDLDAALGHARRWLEVDPLGEAAHARTMLLHAWRGERNEAIHRYRECAAVLDRELGVRPLTRTTALYQAILDGRVERPRHTPAAQVAAVDRAATTSTGDPGQLPLVGRDDELGAAAAHLTETGRLVTVVGEAGIGKSRFVEELESLLHRAEVPVVYGRCHPGEAGLALGPVIELLQDATRAEGAMERVGRLPPSTRAEVSRLLPALAERPATPPTGLDDPGAKARFLDAILTVLANAPGGDRRPPVVVLEDVQHADPATTDLLVYLLNRLGQHRLRLVLTWRAEELPVGHPLRHALRVPTVTDVREAIVLTRLDPPHVRQLCRAGSVDHQQLEQLVRESEGLPLAVVEYLRLLDQTAPEDDRWPIPSGLYELVSGRLTELSETAAQVVTAASVLGHDIDAGVLGRVAGRSEDETVAAVEELLDRGILRANESGSYDFTHEKVATVAYERASPVRRRLLHGRVATELAAVAQRPGGSALAAVVAEHARLGGDLEEAARWYVMAGDRARVVFANTEARAHLERALELGHPDPSAVHRRIATLLVLAGDYAGARDRYDTAAALARDPASLAAIEHELGGLHLRGGRWEAARAHLEEALRILPVEQADRAARVRTDLGLLELRVGTLALAEEHADLALRAAERVDDREAVAQARNLAGLLARRQGRHDDAQRHLEHAAALARSLADPSAYIAALNNLALTTSDVGDVDRARGLLGVAIERCAELGDHHRRAALHNNLADLLHRAGEEEAAMEHLKRAVALFAEVGSSEGPDPEIWKLVDW